MKDMINNQKEQETKMIEVLELTKDVEKLKVDEGGNRWSRERRRRVRRRKRREVEGIGKGRKKRERRRKRVG